MSRNTVEGKVDEYVVLFTPQVRQKQKKWHDGTAKFHHFNNLLVLYDDSNHKIDSTFLGRGRVLELGEELQIDNHLVSLEDLTKTTTRDISGIYTREQNTGLGSNAPPTPRVLQQTTLPPQVRETTKELSNVSKRLKLSLATPVKMTTSTTGKAGTLGPTRLVLEQVSEVPFRAPFSRSSASPAPSTSTSTPSRVPDEFYKPTERRATLRTPTSHLHNSSHSPSTPTRCYTFEDEGEVVETTPVRSPITSPVRSRAQAAPTTVPPLVSAAPNPLAPFKRPYQTSARDTLLNTEPAPAIESVMVRARRAGMAVPPPDERELTTREALICSAIDTQRRSPSLDDLDDFPDDLENDFPELPDYPGPTPTADTGAFSDAFPDLDDINSPVHVKPEPQSPSFQVKEEPLSPMFAAPHRRMFDADIDILSQMHVTIDDSDGDEGMDSFARTTEVIDLVSDGEESGAMSGGILSDVDLMPEPTLMSPYTATRDVDMSSPIVSPVLSPIPSSTVNSQNDTTRVDESDKMAEIEHYSEFSDLGELDSDKKSGGKEMTSGKKETHVIDDDSDLGDLEIPDHPKSPTLKETIEAPQSVPQKASLPAPPASPHKVSPKITPPPPPQPASKSSSFLDKPFTVPFAKRGLETTTTTTTSKTTPRAATRQTSLSTSSKFTISENGPWTKETLELFAWRG